VNLLIVSVGVSDRMALRVYAAVMSINQSLTSDKWASFRLPLVPSLFGRCRFSRSRPLSRSSFPSLYHHRLKAARPSLSARPNHRSRSDFLPLLNLVSPQVVSVIVPQGLFFINDFCSITVKRRVSPIRSGCHAGDLTHFELDRAANMLFKQGYAS